MDNEHQRGGPGSRHYMNLEKGNEKADAKGEKKETTRPARGRSMLI